MPSQLRETYVHADTHSNEVAFKRGLITAGLVSGLSLDWIKPGVDYVNAGDAAADRFLGVRQIYDLQHRHRMQVRAAGGDYHLLSGNHDAEHFGNLGGEFKMPNTRIAEHQYKALKINYKLIHGDLPASWEDVHNDTLRTHNDRGAQKARIEMLKNHVIGKQWLSLIRDHKLMHQVGDTLIMHVQPNKEILRQLALWGVDLMNLRYNLSLNAWLDGDITFTEVYDNFEEFFSVDCRWNGLHTSYSELANGFKDLGINRVVTGHTRKEINGNIQWTVSSNSLPEKHFEWVAQDTGFGITTKDPDGIVPIGVLKPDGTYHASQFVY